MIQRIQSIYLLLASAASGLQFLVPYATVPAENPPVGNAVFADGRFEPLDNMGLLGLVALGALVAAVAIFLFSNRKQQALFAGLGALVSVLALALAAFVFFNAGKTLPTGGAASFGLGFGLPVLAFLFNLLAQRAIRKDENLVRSMDRLR